MEWDGTGWDERNGCGERKEVGGGDEVEEELQEEERGAVVVVVMVVCGRGWEDGVTLRPREQFHEFKGSGSCVLRSG